MLSLLRSGARFLLLTFFIVLIIIALLTGLLRIGLPYMSTYKSEIQGWVSNYLKTPIDIGSMEFAWNGARPSLTLDRVSLIGAGKRNVDVKLDQVALDVNLVKSLLAADLHINQVTLSGADLALEYEGGEFQISGGLRGNGNSSSGKRSNIDVFAWLMNAKRVGLLDSRIELIDTDRDINYVIDDLNIRAENDGDFHQLRLDLGLPRQLGYSLEVGIDLTGDSDSLEESVGNFYIKAPSLEFTEWLRIWPDRHFDLKGWSNVEAWGSWGDGYLQTLRATVDGSDLKLDVNPSVSSSIPATLHLPKLVSDLYWARQHDGWSASIDKFEFEYEGELNRINQLEVVQRRRPDDNSRKLSVDVDGNRLRLETVSALLSALESVDSLESISQTVAAISPEGELTDWSFSTDLSEKSPTVSVAGTFTDIATKTHRKIPGFKNITGKLELVDGVGQVELALKNAAIHSPQVFPESLSIEQLDAVLNVDLNDPDKLISSENIFTRDNDALAYSFFELSQTKDKDLYVNIKSAFSVDDVTSAGKYFPTGIMRPSLIEWLQSSVRGGRVEKGQLLMVGKLKDFPYDNKQGVFRVDVDINDGELKFLPDWPAAKSVVGHLHFDGPGMSFQARRGTLARTRVFDVTGGIENFWRPTLVLAGESEGNLQRMLNFANEGPLSSILSPALGETTGTGSGALALELSVPLMSTENRKPEDILTVDGKVVLNENRVVFNRFDLDLDAVRGTVNFNEEGVDIRNVSGRYLGNRVTLTARTVGSDGNRETRLKVRGQVRADRVLSNYELPVSSFFSGSSDWEVDVAVPYQSARGQPIATLRAESRLKGTEIRFPAPLNKSGESSRQVAVNGSFYADDTQRWRVTYDGFKTALVAAPDAGMKSLAVRIGNGALPSVSDGIRVVGRSNRLDFNGWITAVNQIIEELPESSGDAKTLLMPISGEINTKNMMVGTTSLGPASFRANTDDLNLNGVVENRHLRGNIRQPRRHWDETEVVRARIARVDQTFLSALETSGDAEGESDPLDPRAFPPMEIRVAEFVKSPLILRNITMRTVPDDAGLTVTALGFANNNAQVTGEGYWHLADPQQVNPALANQHRTRLQLSLRSNDIGRTFSAMGFAGSMAEGRGTINALLRWQGPGYVIEPARIIGSLDLNLKDGRFLRVDPGAARLVGLFAFQELPRRLSLDFRDLVSEGLDYGTIRGNLDLSGGIARIGFLQLEGPIGVIEVAGYTNLVDRTFDQSITVLPRLSAAVPILALLSGGATAGIGALVATPVLKALGVDFDRLGLSEYKLSGSWDAPVIEAIAVPGAQDQ